MVPCCLSMQSLHNRKRVAYFSNDYKYFVSTLGTKSEEGQYKCLFNYVQIGLLWIHLSASGTSLILVFYLLWSVTCHKFSHMLAVSSRFSKYPLKRCFLFPLYFEVSSLDLNSTISLLVYLYPLWFSSYPITTHT